RLESLLLLGRLARDVGHDHDAERHFHAALDLAPQCQPALEALEEIYAAAGRDADLAEILKRRMTGERDADRLLELGLRPAALLEGRLGRRREAITALQKVLALHPLHAGALARLATLAQAEGLHAERALALERLAELRETAPPAAE